MPQIIIIISIGIIIIILGRNIPKANDLNEENLFFEKKKVKKDKEIFFYLYRRIKNRISKERNQEKVHLMWVWLEKILRKIRISFLKIDNQIISLLGKLREKHIATEIDKSEGSNNMQKDKDTKKEEVEENDINKKEAGFMENDLQKIEVLENINSGAIENKKKEIINNISKEEDTKGKEKEYLDVILKNPIDIKTYWKLGIIYSRRRNYKDAISCFRQITKIDPTYKKAKKKISDLIKKMKKREKEEK